MTAPPPTARPARSRRPGTPAGRAPRRPLRAARTLLALAAIGLAGYFLLWPEARATYHWFRAGRALDEDDFGTARGHLEACAAAWPASAETRFLLARTCRRDGNAVAARRHLWEARRLGWLADLIDLEFLLLEAQCGGGPRAEKVLGQKLARGHPEHALILEALVRGAIAGNFARDAYRWAAAWTEGQPREWRAWYWRGRALEAAGQRELAGEDYERVLGQKPGHPEAALRLAGVWLAAGRFDEARRLYQTCLGRDPGWAEALLGLAECQRALGAPAQCRDTLRRVLSEVPDQPAACLLCGRLELEDDRPAEAVEWLRRAEGRAPRDRAVLKALATALRQLKRPGEADGYEARLAAVDRDFQALETVARETLARPREAPLRREAGLLSLRLGRKEEACRWLVSALLLDPGDAAARRALADCLPPPENAGSEP